ncbi:MAG: nitroreductase/quinone reductase family protein [Myxococcota bacterium]
MYKNFMNWFSTTPVGKWLAIRISANLDPLLYKLSGGRITSIGPQVIPQLVLTTVGRKSGQKRTVQLAFTADGNDFLVVASNFGREKHPGWSYNLDANPDAEVQVGPEVHAVKALRLSEDEKAALWSRIEATVPQMKVYPGQTDRNIKVYRLAAS